MKPYQNVTMQISTLDMSDILTLSYGGTGVDMLLDFSDILNLH